MPMICGGQYSGSRCARVGAVQMPTAVQRSRIGVVGEGSKAALRGTVCWCKAPSCLNTIHAIGHLRRVSVAHLKLQTRRQCHLLDLEGPTKGLPAPAVLQSAGALERVKQIGSLCKPVPIANRSPSSQSDVCSQTDPFPDGQRSDGMRIPSVNDGGVGSRGNSAPTGSSTWALLHSPELKYLEEAE